MIQAAKATAHVLLLAAVCLPVFANIPRTPLVAEKPHQGVADFALTLHRAESAANALNAPGIAGCLYDSGIRPCCSGKERDAETGLDYFGARYFSGAQGRFTSADPIFVTSARLRDPQMFNLYGYSRNNPFRFFDPTGLDPVPVACDGPTSGNCYSTELVEAERREDEQFAQGNKRRKQKPKPKNQPVEPAPVGPNGVPLPPPVPVPGCPQCGWEWSPDPLNERGGQWRPVGYPKTPGGHPGASWDTGSRGGPGHWDVDDGSGERQRYYPDGRPMPDDVAHPPGWRPTWMNDISAQDVGIVVGGIGGSYLLYRGVRLLPSLLPPLWPTLIPNLIAP